MRTNFGKLVRDGLPLRIQGQGARPVVRTLEEDEFLRELKARLIEHAWELYYANERGEDAVLPYAELFETLSWMMRVQGISPEEIFAKACSEREVRGGFSERCFLVAIEDASEVANAGETG